MSEFVFDYAAGLPWVVDGAVDAAIDEAAAEGASVREAVQRATVRQFRDDPAFREAYRETFERAGVDVASITISSREPATSIFDWSAMFDAADWLQKVTTPDDARDAAAGDGAGVVLNTQNLGAAIDGDVDGVERLYDAGVRIFQLTYNTQNLVGAGCYARSDCGLSRHGVEVVERVTDLGGIVDLSHCGRATALDAIEVAAAPPAATHVGCAAVYDHPRGKTDEVLEAIAAADGYVGVVGVPWFLAAEDASLSTFADHVEHAVEVVGPERVGIGTDFRNVDANAPDRYVDDAREHAVDSGFPEGYGEGYGGGFDRMTTYADWRYLRDELEARFDAETVDGVLGGNFLAYWERVRDHAGAQ
jgi:membrane dipeptidase